MEKAISNDKGKGWGSFVIITETNNGFNYSDFIKNEMVGCRVFNSPKLMSGDDWRNVAVNFGLSLSKAEWVWFTEQDFTIIEEFWKGVDKMIGEGCELVSVMVADRMHPCSILAKREIIEKTQKEFGIKADKLDHFGIFQKDIEKLDIQTGVIGYGYEHMNGLSSNFSLISRGEKPNYQPERFRRYIKDCLKSGMKLHPYFEKVCRGYLNE